MEFKSCKLLTSQNSCLKIVLEKNSKILWVQPIIQADLLLIL